MTAVTMANHTPGPWCLMTVFGPSGLPVVASATSKAVIAECYQIVDAGVSFEAANARLIAAAPDLLATLESIVDAMRPLAARKSTRYASLYWAIEEADRIIAKIERGE